MKAELEVYSGAALDWFSWIDLFKALVHNSNKTPGEKLAILKRNLKGNLTDIVYGLGGGEAAYKEALVRLKENCERRDVMRAAHLHVLDKLEPGKGTTFKRFAERVRTHLFDLDRIGGVTSPDLIGKLSKKLIPQDLLEWNSGGPRFTGRPVEF